MEEEYQNGLSTEENLLRAGMLLMLGAFLARLVTAIVFGMLIYVIILYFGR
jgi:hypothetical protein